MHEGTSSRVNLDGSKSLQEFVPTEVTYSSGDMVIALQEVLSRSLQFHNGTYTELPNSIKFILDNLQAAFTLKHHTLFQKTLQALEIHLVNTIAINEAYVCQLFGKENIHSKDKKTIMGTDYARLSLKTQSLLRSAIDNLPTEIQLCILESKAMFRSFDLWFKYFKIPITTAAPDLANSDDLSDILGKPIGKNTLRAVSECMKRSILFLVFLSAMKMVRMLLIGILIGCPKCLSMALSDS